MYLLYPVNLLSLTFKWIEPFKFLCFQDKIFAVSRCLGQPSLTYASERENTQYTTRCRASLCLQSFCTEYDTNTQDMLMSF